MIDEFAPADHRVHVVALDSDQPPYAMVERTASIEATTDEDGSLWLFVGTDSGFEGRTSIYYDRIEVVLSPQA